MEATYAYFLRHVTDAPKVVRVGGAFQKLADHIPEVAPADPSQAKKNDVHERIWLMLDVQ